MGQLDKFKRHFCGSGKMDEERTDVAILVHDLSSTGVVLNAIRIAGAASEAGLKAELWVLHEHGWFASRLPCNVTVHALRVRRSALARRHEMLLAVPGIAAEIRKRKPKVLFSAGNHCHLAAGLAYRLAGRPPETRFIGRASNATPRAALPIVSAIANAKHAFKYREMERVIAVSQELADNLINRVGIPAERTLVIANGVDLDAAARQAQAPLDDPWYAEGEPPVIISAGRLAAQKNYPILIDAFRRVRQERPLRLIILGEGSAKAKAALQRQVDRHGISADVRLHGFEPNPMRYFSRSALFVLSSLWEGASNVLLEALACGCPVVATDCPTGVREQLDNGRIAPLVPLNDAVALARAIAARLDAPRDSEALRQQAARFSQTHMLAAYLRLFTSDAEPRMASIRAALTTGGA